MPRLRVIVLEETDLDTYRYVLWADVPIARQRYYANAGAQSAWKDATAADNSALQSGSVAETVSTQRVPAGSTLAQIESFLQVQWVNYQTFITDNNPWMRYGSTWDGATWSIANNG